MVAVEGVVPVRWFLLAVLLIAGVCLLALLGDGVGQAPPQSAPAPRAPVVEGAWWSPAPEQLAFAEQSGWPLWFESQGGLRFVLLPPGRFMMGSPENEPERSDDEHRREVVIQRGFYVSVTEVTNAQFRRRWPAHQSGSYDGKSLAADDQPVAKISWRDARDYCRWLGKQEGSIERYRLPTEAEWEYAARAGSHSAYWWGEDPDRTRFNGYGAADGFAVSAPVGRYRPNRWGLFDTAGNVWEWCEDVYSASGAAVGEVTDEEWIRLLHVLRGGSWFASIPGRCRSAARGSSPLQSWQESHGFRVAASAPPLTSPAPAGEGQ